MARPSPSEPRTPSYTEVDATDWPAQAADAIERAVQGVRDKTTGPAITVARWVVAGLFLVVAGTAALILLTVLLVRLLDAYLPDSVFGEDHVWAAHTILGLLVTGVGLVLLRKRNRPAGDAS
jgi:hypothetical protein